MNKKLSIYNSFCCAKDFSLFHFYICILLLESSRYSQRQLQERSSGDGEDSPVCRPHDTVPFFSSSQAVAAPIAGAQLPALVPPSGELAGIRKLMPYKIDVTPKLSARKKRHKMTPSKLSVQLHMISEKVEPIIDQNSSSNLEESVSHEDSKECERANSPVMERVKTLVKKLTKEAVIAPLDSELLNTPPKEIENKAKIAITPRPTGVPVTRHSSVKYTQLSRKVYKEPKFVPYEPYKGCANAMFGDKPAKKVIKKEFALTSQPRLPEVTATPGVHKDHDTKARAKLEMIVKDFELERSTWEDQLKEMTARCKQLEQDLAKNKREKVTLEDQLNVQAQVRGVILSIYFYVQ